MISIEPFKPIRKPQLLCFTTNRTKSPSTKSVINSMITESLKLGSCPRSSPSSNTPFISQPTNISSVGVGTRIVLAIFNSAFNV